MDGVCFFAREGCFSLTRGGLANWKGPVRHTLGEGDREPGLNSLLRRETFRLFLRKVAF